MAMCMDSTDENMNKVKKALSKAMRGKAEKWLTGLKKVSERHA